VTLLQIAIACNSADRLLTRPLQEGLDSLKKPETTGSSSAAVTVASSSSRDMNPTYPSPAAAGGRDEEQQHSQHQQSHTGSLPKRSVSYDLPNDSPSLSVTEEQLTSLGTIQQHLWKALRFKIQRFYVPNVTTPQVGRLSTALTKSILVKLMSAELLVVISYLH
jgi:hypothetical protein